MYKRGAVVLIPFPFSDLAGDKVRPALIISNVRSNDVIVIFITSKQKVGKSKYKVHLDPNADNGLKVRSNIICDKFATLDKKIILGELGFVSKDVLKKVEKILGNVLGL